MVEMLCFPITFLQPVKGRIKIFPTLHNLAVALIHAPSLANFGLFPSGLTAPEQTGIKDTMSVNAATNSSDESPNNLH